MTNPAPMTPVMHPTMIDPGNTSKVGEVTLLTPNLSTEELTSTILAPSMPCKATASVNTDRAHEKKTFQMIENFQKMLKM